MEVGEKGKKGERSQPVSGGSVRPPPFRPNGKEDPPCTWRGQKEETTSQGRTIGPPFIKRQSFFYRGRGKGILSRKEKKGPSLSARGEGGVKIPLFHQGGGGEGGEGNRSSRKWKRPSPMRGDGQRKSGNSPF